MDVAAVHHGSLHARHPGQVGGHAIERGLDRQRRQMPHLGQRPHLDQATLAQDAHPVAQGLDLTQDVRRQEHGLPGIAGLGHAVAERLLHERVEPGGGLVEHEQVGARHQGGDEQYLLPVALGVGPDLLGRIEVEPLDQLVAVRGVDPALDPPQEMKCLGPGERRPQVGLAGDVGEPPVCLARSGAGSRARRSRPAPPWAGPAPGAGGWWWSSRRRSAPGSRRPRPGRPRGRGRAGHRRSRSAWTDPRCGWPEYP